jgi:hypothetical protein
LVLLLVVQSNAQDICGVQIFGAKNAEEARQKASSSLAQAINSKISSHSKTEETITGIESSQKDTTVQQVSSQLLNAQAVKYTDGRDGNGYSSKACMSAKDAAKPYLDSLKYIAGLLKNATQKINKESCSSINELYKNIKDLESVLIPLNQMDSALQKEYEGLWERTGKECNSAAKGVYIESNEPYFAGRISSLIAGEGCLLTETAENSALKLKINSSECEQKTDNIMETSFCNICVELDLQNSKTGKSLYKDSFTGSKVGWADMKNACKKAMEKAVLETWEKIKGKISKGDCQ